MKKYIFLFFCVTILSITNAQRRVNFSDKISKQYNNYADFTNKTFMEFENFTQVRFLDSADFEGAYFSKKITFENTRFSKCSAFLGSQLIDTANFTGTQFYKYANFSNAVFSKFANFGGVNFLDTADFNEVQFSKVNFAFTKFTKSVNFFGAVFKAKSRLNLSNITLDSCHFNFYKAVFPDTIIFANNNTIKNDIFFTNANYTSPSRFDKNADTAKRILIYLQNSDIAKLHLNYIYFKLLLPDSTIEFDGIPKKFIAIDEKTSTYEALLNNFKINGQTESYQRLDIEYKEFKWRQHIWTRYLVWLPRLWWNFGYDKENIFAVTGIFLMIFTCFTYFFLFYLNNSVYKIEKIEVDKSWGKQWSFKDFRRRFWFSFMYTSTVFFKLSVDIEKLEFKRKWGTIYIITIYTIGILCIAYMANFVLQKV